jgi:queuine tRNA-ribosyltransferase
MGFASVQFKLEATCARTRARAGRLSTPRGEVLTPAFMPVGTRAAVRIQDPAALKEMGAQMLLANAYHLTQRPGLDVLRSMGGVQRFMGWDGPVLTDSGGYQLFSLAGAAVAEEGASFVDPATGIASFMSPEDCIRAQQAIGSDVMMALDHCVPSTSPLPEARAAMELTHRWARRCLAERAKQERPQALFGIVQGAVDPGLRRESADRISEMATGEMPFDGIAIGGLAVGESRSEREDITELVTERLPSDRPRYLMGVGTPADLVAAVRSGVDLFDCVMPTMFAQRGAAFTSEGKLQLRRQAYARSEDALDRDCRCGTCRSHSRAYLHHLIKASEPLGWLLVGRHNLSYYLALMRGIRASILAGTFLRSDATDEARGILGSRALDEAGRLADA